ncbi:YheC/YheD family protein [Cohnella sp. JJ-181]|uniref:YheC/YheD family protein n=1 Tax=Cohnella rhizoplanae TaxID=2974897 RepID=UPI0022FF9E72|nr:YheC/YheD family protein [Cohnella sp. JJ-181]CAI6040239.1 Endospore coat-associated protein YheD [Cohnella sp. JJ-181]
MHQNAGRMLASKWLKTKALLANGYVARHIPPTRIYSAGNLKSMLERYGMVVLKPVRGAGGHGVLKATRIGRGYQLHAKSRIRTFGTFAGLCGYIRRLKGRRAYLIQQGIRLATIGGRPVDYRVKHVKTAAGWQIRAMVGRVARPGLFVTNLCRGGTRITAGQGIARSLSPRMVAAKKSHMRHLTRTSTALLESRFPGIGQLGYDYAIDRGGRIWMLEVNTRPQ